MQILKISESSFDEEKYLLRFFVDLRHKANAENPLESMGRLAALRWPEKLVMYDDGEWSELFPGMGPQDIHGKVVVYM